MRIKADHTLYGNFQDILTGYRLTTVLMQVHESGVVEYIGADGACGDDICKHAEWEGDAGGRFLETLCGIGLLCREDGRFFLTAFSRRFLLKESDHYQGDALEFEKKLIDSWGMLGDTLQSGRREYGAEEKSPEEYRQALETYIGAMDNAARVRSAELWDMLPIVGDKTGRILDVGAGSGAYLKEFLGRHSGWSGIFCDLADVVEKAKTNPGLSFCRDRVTFRPCNLLDPDSGLGDMDCKVDIAFLSNIVHCYAEDEISVFIKNALDKVSETGCVIVHDFFRDRGWRGSLYDTHMVLNTFSGRTYATGEIITVLKRAGFAYSLVRDLPSGSSAVIAAKDKMNIDIYEQQ